MTRYFVNGKEITKTEADQIERDNAAIMAQSEKTGDINLLFSCKFITVLEGK